ncbi:MAG: hypothetical protein ACOCZH_06340, partial [Phototrophicaceae bacterium]
MSTKARRISSASPKSEAVRRWLALLVLLLTGCAAAASDNSPAPHSAWGPVVTLAQAAQIDAPALWLDGATVRAAWTGHDDHPHALMWAGIPADSPDPSPTAERLTLPVTFPHAWAALPAASQHTHLLWLDADPADASGTRRLWL